MKFKSSISLGIIVSLIFFPLNLLAQSSWQLVAESNPSNLDDLPDDPEQMMSWKCSDQDSSILIEAKDDNIWKSIIDPNSWNCQPGLSDTSKGNLKFTCEPTQEGMISLVTITWLTGNDQTRQMGQWLHELADEHNMICSMAKVELWDNDVTTP